MRIEPTASFLFNFVTTWWTPLFVALFVVVILYAFWPRNRETFDDAAKLPLRED